MFLERMSDEHKKELIQEIEKLDEYKGKKVEIKIITEGMATFSVDGERKYVISDFDVGSYNKDLYLAYTKYMLNTYKEMYMNGLSNFINNRLLVDAHNLQVNLESGRSTNSCIKDISFHSDVLNTMNNEYKKIMEADNSKQSEQEQDLQQ